MTDDGSKTVSNYRAALKKSELPRQCKTIEQRIVQYIIEDWNVREEAKLLNGTLRAFREKIELFATRLN